jgi:hypothetical protein
MAKDRDKKKKLKKRESTGSSEKRVNSKKARQASDPPAVPAGAAGISDQGAGPSEGDGQ